MKKLLIFFVVFCMMAGSVVVHAENHSRTDTISLGESKTITIPQPEGEIDPGFVYFTQEFTFVPEQDGTYRFMVRCEDDAANPYEFFMDVAGEYRQLENGCEFEGKAGESYSLCFQYPTHDGRYPEFTFYVYSEDLPQVPQTGDAGILMPAAAAMLSFAAMVLLMPRRKETV